ncbi:MAG TPA: helix-turn-helix domain-containing protein, partial [Candidatus Acetothermia bacterium]|nr:helix-turn-helix domain-containing protein [Candidatus Acetothermia bacterium]
TLLRLLASSPGRVFSDQEILREVWPDSRYANSKDVKQYVYLVRQRLGKVRPGAEGMIVTVPGFGYKLVSPDELGLTER